MLICGNDLYLVSFGELWIYHSMVLATRDGAQGY